MEFVDRIRGREKHFSRGQRTIKPLPVLALALLLTACSASPSASETTATSPAVSPSASAETPTPTPTKKPLSVTIAGAGDVLPHGAVVEDAKRNAGGNGYDFSPMFAEVAPVISAADIAICQMEVPLSADNSNIQVGSPQLVFNGPREVADAVKKAGYDGCNFASNHTIDQGLEGITATHKVLDEAGLKVAGATMNKEESGKPAVYQVGDASVAHLAYTYTYPNSGSPNTTIPDGAPWLIDNSWPNIGSAGIIEQAKKAKDAGADFVVVSMHWGNEYQQEPTADQTRIANDLLNSEYIDLILGAHVHVIQPCQKINGKHVIYGMGNQLSNQSAAFGLLPSTQDGIIPTFTLTKDVDGKVSSQMEYVPTFVDLNGHIVKKVTKESNPDSWQRTTSAVDALGGCDAKAIG